MRCLSPFRPLPDESETADELISSAFIPLVARPIMQFRMTGHTQTGGFRVFSFQGVGEDRVRIKFTVRVNLALSQRHGLRLQELPLICLAFLERDGGGPEPRDLTFDEAAIVRYLEEQAIAAEAAAAAQKKPTPRGRGKVTPDEDVAPPEEIAPTADAPYWRKW